MKNIMYLIKNDVGYPTRVAKTAFSFTVLIDEASCGCRPGLSTSDYVSFYITQLYHYDLSMLNSFIATHYSYSNIQVVPERFCVSPNWFIAFYLKFQNAF